MAQVSTNQRSSDGKRSMMVSRTWVQVAALVVLFGFTVLGFLAFRTYETGPPIADRVLSQDGTVIFTGADVTAGQELFLKNGLMEYGSVFGHGAYLGPDFTADYLHRAAVIATGQYGGSASDTAQKQVIKDFKTNQYDAASRTLTYTSAQATAFEEMVGYYANYFGPTSHDKGLVTNAISDRTQIRQLTSFFAWTAWSGSTLRPDKNYSYTNSWPPEPLVGNSPPANVLVWSVLSLIALLAGIGALFAAFGRWGDRFGWKGRQAESISFRPPGGVVLTPAQRACAYYFLVVGLLFFIQTMVGAASEHYRADITSFFGFDLARWLPYNLVRTWHVQLSIFWTATSFLAAGIFLTPMIAGREPRRQHWLAYGLLGVLAVVVFGSMAGEYLDIHGLLSGTLHTFGMQGFEYIDLGRFWQVLLTVGLVIWVIILYRGLRGRLRNESRSNMPWMFFFTALAIPAFYQVGLLASSEDSFTVADFWRFMVVHLWVEDFLEIFTTVLVAYIFVMLGVVRERVALKVIYLTSCSTLPAGSSAPCTTSTSPEAPRRAWPWRVLLGDGGDSADVSHGRGVVVPAAGCPPGVQVHNAVPAPLGGDVPGLRRLLELPRRRHLRLPGQPADCVVLRDRHRPDRQPRARRDDGCLRDARDGAGALLPALPHPGRALARPAGQDLVLVSQHRPRLDVLRHAAAPGHPAALRVGQRRLLRRPSAVVHHRPDQQRLRVDAYARRSDPHPRRCPALPLHLLAWRPIPGAGVDADPAQGRAVHRDHRTGPSRSR